MAKKLNACAVMLILFLLTVCPTIVSGIGSTSEEKQLTELNRKASEIVLQSPEKAIDFATQALKIAISTGNRKGKATALKNLGVAHYLLTNYRQSLEYYQQSLTIYRELKDNDGIGSVLNNKGLIYEIQGDYSGALKCYLDALEIFTNEANEKYQANSYTNIGNVYYSLGRFDKSLEYQLQSLKLNEKIGDSTGISKAYNNIGNIYLSLKDYKFAEQHFNKALVINKSQNNLQSLSTSYNNLGIALQGQGRNKESLEYNRLAIEIARRINDKIGIASSLVNIGNIYLDEGNLTQAELNFNEALRISGNSLDGLTNASILSSMATLKIKQNDFDEAISLLNESLNFAEKSGSELLLQDIYASLADAWQNKGDYKRAFEFLTKQKTSVDSIYNLESSERLNRLRVSFESEQIERDNQQLRQQNIFSQLALKRQQIIRNLLIVISIIVIVFSTFLFSMNQSKKRKNELLAERNKQILLQKEELNQLYKEQFKLNETKNKFFSIVAHDLKSPFQSILGFSELLSSEYENLTEIQRREAAVNILNVSNDTFRLIENLLEWGRTQTGSARAVFKAFNVRELVIETLPIFQPQLHKKNIQLSYDLPQMLQAWADPDMTMAILRNLVSNAVKFTPPGGNIHLGATQSDGMVNITVKDSGTGIPPEILENLFTFDPKVQRSGTMGERGTGLGLALCLEFMELNHGIIKVESIPGTGSTFTMMLQPMHRISQN